MKLLTYEQCPLMRPDAIGRSREELRYILDPKDVYGPNFPCEKSRVLKEKEERAYGEYRTRRLVLEVWNRRSTRQASRPNWMAPPITRTASRPVLATAAAPAAVASWRSATASGSRCSKG